MRDEEASGGVRRSWWRKREHAKGGRGKEVVEGEGGGRTRRNEGGRVRRSWSEWRRKEAEEGGGRGKEGGKEAERGREAEWRRSHPGRFQWSYFCIFCIL